MNRDERDYYEVLGVRRDAGADAIKKAFRARARELHPDISHDPAATDEFSELARAYSVLSKSTSRILYDRVGYRGLGNGGFASAVSERTDASERPARFEFAQLEVGSLEATRGTTRKVRLTTVGTCPACAGRGAAPGTSVDACSSCEGEGRRRTSTYLGSARLLQIEQCPECGGSGRIVAEACGECGGGGRANVERTLSVPIPPGAEDGRMIRVSGDRRLSDTAGRVRDVYVVVRVLPDRDSRSLRYAAAVVLAVAVLLFVVFLLAPDSLTGRP